MTPKALIVEDDPDIAELVGDVLDSIGHGHDLARSQDEARSRIASSRYDYVLLDLEIPVRVGRGLPQVAFGEQLAREICRAENTRQAPQIVMTAHGREGMDVAESLFASGVVSCIHKPFPRTGRTLQYVITKAIAGRSCTPTDLPEQAAPKPTTFSGGELVFERERALLLGVPVLSARKAKRMWTILRVLAGVGGRPRRAYSGAELAEAIGGGLGQNDVAGAVRGFREGVAKILRSEARVEVGEHDVVETTPGGYRLNGRVNVVVQSTSGPVATAEVR